MKKKLFLVIAIIAVLSCLFAISVCAATPEMYIEFDVKLSGESDYITVYTESAEGNGNPRVDMNYEFYKDIDFTEAVDKTAIVAIDFSDARAYGMGDAIYVTRLTKASTTTLYPNCSEVKWFSNGLTSPDSGIFNKWSQLTKFDFGCMTTIPDNFLEGTSLTEVVIPAATTKTGNGVFMNCKSLTSVTIQGGLTSIGSELFKGCTALESVDLGSSTKTGNSMFSGCTSLDTITYKDGPKQDGAFFLPPSITSLSSQAFYECKTVKYVSIPATVTYVGPACFHSCTSLQFVDFNNNQNDVDFNNWGAFMNCTSLKAISLPTNVDYITNRFFSKCTSLKAVYLPSALKTIETNGYGEQTAFYNCYDMYFVNEPFNVRDENGNFYGDSFQMPAKPEIYYFPSNLQKIFDRDSGIGFANCYSLNSVMVFPTTLTRFWINDGVFYCCGDRGATFTIVFLGDMTDLRIGLRDTRAKGVSYVFANPNDVDLSSVNIQDSNAGSTPTLTGQESIFFCKSGKGFNLYNLGGESDPTQFTSENTTLVDMDKHLRNPNADRTSDATCTEAAGSFTFCFCGHKLSESLVPGSEPLGHDSEGADVSIYFPTVNEIPNYFLDRIHAYVCQRCAETIEESQLGTALFSADGYSTFTEMDKSTGKTTNCISHTIRINKNNVTDFEALTGNKVNYGIVAGVGTSLGSPVTLDGEKAVPNGTAVSADMTGTDYTKLVIKVTGLTNESEISCNAYVVLNSDATKIYYLCGNEVTKTALAKKFA